MFVSKNEGVDASKGLQVVVPNGNSAYNKHQVSVESAAGSGNLELWYTAYGTKTAQQVRTAALVAIVFDLSVAVRTIMFEGMVEKILFVPSGSTGTVDIVVTSATDLT